MTDQEYSILSARATALGCTLHRCTKAARVYANGRFIAYGDFGELMIFFDGFSQGFKIFAERIMHRAVELAKVDAQ